MIVVEFAPEALGIDSNPTVQAWVGANVGMADDGDVLTTERDPILGAILPGTWVTGCGHSVCGALVDTSGHPFAKVLARLRSGTGRIAIMRNYWEGGVSVFLTRFISPYGDPLQEEIILNTVQARNTIPALSTWGLLTLVLGVVLAGTIVLRRRGSLLQVATSQGAGIAGLCPANVVLLGLAGMVAAGG